MDEVDERRIAVHEAGHVVVAYTEDVRIQRVTLDAKEAEDRFGGVWFHKPVKVTEEHLFSRGRIAWAGSVAESLVFDSALQTSWMSDVKAVYELADKYGQRMGPVYVGKDTKEAARQALQTNRNALDKITELLLRHRTVNGERLTAILNGLVV